MSEENKIESIDKSIEEASSDALGALTGVLSASTVSSFPGVSISSRSSITAAAPLVGATQSTVYISTNSYNGAGNIYGQNYTYGPSIYSPSIATSVLSICGGPNQSEIVRVNKDGSVTWNGNINIDAAAEAFSKMLTLSAELRAGITESVKLQIRDKVFNSIINIARDKGSLTADDLTFMLEASKIVEKLKGIDE